MLAGTDMQLGFESGQSKLQRSLWGVGCLSLQKKSAKFIIWQCLGGETLISDQCFPNQVPCNGRKHEQSCSVTLSFSIKNFEGKPFWVSTRQENSFLAEWLKKLPFPFFSQIHHVHVTCVTYKWTCLWDDTPYAPQVRWFLSKLLKGQGKLLDSPTLDPYT